LKETNVEHNLILELVLRNSYFQ